jgi:hypothetical protein
MTSASEVAREEPRARRVILPFLLVAAAFGVVEYVVESIPGFLSNSLDVNSRGASAVSLYHTLDAIVKVSLVPVALFLAFYFLAARGDLDLRRSYFAVALSIFAGTLLVFVPIDVGQIATGTPLPGFTSAEAVVVSISDAISSSLNHAFIGFSAVFLWQLVAKPPSSASYLGRKEGLHGTEDISIVGVVILVVYIWEYLAQAYQATYLLGVRNEPAAVIASLLGAGSPIYYTVAVLQQTLLLMVFPFVLYFLVARNEGLNPFVQGRKIALSILLWAVFLRVFTSYFYVYFARLFDPAAFAGQTIVSTISSEFVPMNLIPIAASTLAFLFLGMTAVVFGFYSRESAKEAVTPATAGVVRQEPGLVSG